jgi:FkbM family methyltransferase
VLVPISNDLYTEFALSVKKFLRIAKIDPGRLPEEWAKYSFLLQMLQFLQIHDSDISHLGGERFWHKELREIVYLGPDHLSTYKPFFEFEGKIKFFKRNGQIFAEIKDHVFALPFPHGLAQLDMVFLKDRYGECNVQGSSVVDVGAFIGDTAVYFASRGARKVLAFEAAPPLFRLAEQNVLLNHVEDVVQMKNAALSDRNGFAHFNYSAFSPQSSSYLDSKVKNPTEFVVESVSVSKVISSLEYVDLLKLNCEGAEHQILQQAHELNLFKKIGNIMVEIHGIDEKIRGYLKSASYKIVSDRFCEEGVHYIFATKN